MASARHLLSRFLLNFFQTCHNRNPCIPQVDRDLMRTVVDSYEQLSLYARRAQMLTFCLFCLHLCVPHFDQFGQLEHLKKKSTCRPQRRTCGEPILIYSHKSRRIKHLADAPADDLSARIQHVISRVLRSIWRRLRMMGEILHIWRVPVPL